MGSRGWKFKTSGADTGRLFSSGDSSVSKACGRESRRPQSQDSPASSAPPPRVGPPRPRILISRPANARPIAVGRAWAPSARCPRSCRSRSGLSGDSGRGRPRAWWVGLWALRANRVFCAATRRWCGRRGDGFLGAWREIRWRQRTRRLRGR